MINRIMTSGVAAVALAASAFFALPAAADPVRSNASLTIQIGSNGASVYRDVRRGSRYGVNQWGQRRHEVRQLRRDAVRACSASIERQAYRVGFRDVDIDNDLRVHQIGPYGFEVRFDDVEFEGRRRDFERDVTCVVRRGNVVQVAGLPQPRRAAYRATSRRDVPVRRVSDDRRGGRR